MASATLRGRRRRLRPARVRVSAQRSGADRDLPAGRLSDRLLGVDQPAQVQPQAPAASSSSSASRTTPTILDSTEFWSALWITVQFTVAGGRPLVTVLGVLRRAAAQSAFPRPRPRAHADPAAVGDTAGRQRPDVAMDLRLEDRRAERPAGRASASFREYRGWLSDPTSALLALAFADVWNVLPLAVILLLAALQKIPGRAVRIRAHGRRRAVPAVPVRHLSRGSRRPCSSCSFCRRCPRFAPSTSSTC